MLERSAVSRQEERRAGGIQISGDPHDRMALHLGDGELSPAPFVESPNATPAQCAERFLAQIIEHTHAW